MNKPHIRLQHYPKSKRSYWRVSPVPKKWNRLSDTEKAHWNAAHKFKERLNSQRVTCESCGKELNKGVDIEAIVKEYVEARDAYEDATQVHRISFAHPKRLPHGDAITRRWVDARAALYKAISHVKLGEVRIEHAT